MSSIDLAVVAIVLISALVGTVRGFARELVSFLTWFLAIVITVAFTAQFATLLPAAIENPTARAGIGAVTLFLGCMLIGALIDWLFRRAARGFSLGAVDRVLGFLFGVGRALIIVTLVVLAANLVPALKQETWWRESFLVPRFQMLARVVHGTLPPGIAQHFDFGDAGVEV